ncbi:hypothetical protein [Enterococcus sp. LJL90]
MESVKTILVVCLCIVGFFLLLFGRVLDLQARVHHFYEEPRFHSAILEDCLVDVTLRKQHIQQLIGYLKEEESSPKSSDTSQLQSLLDAIHQQSVEGYSELQAMKKEMAKLTQQKQQLEDELRQSQQELDTLKEETTKKN